MSGSTNIPPSMDGTTTASSDLNTVTGPSIQIEAHRPPQSPLVAPTNNVVTQFSPAMSSPEASKDDPPKAVEQGEDTKTSTAVDPEKDAHESVQDKTSKTSEDENDAGTSMGAKDGVDLDPGLLIPSFKDPDLLSSLGHSFSDCGYNISISYIMKVVFGVLNSLGLWNQDNYLRQAQVSCDLLALPSLDTLVKSDLHLAPNKKPKSQPPSGNGGDGDDDDNGDDPFISDNEDIVDSEDEDDIEDMIRTDDDVKEVSIQIKNSQSKLHRANALVHSIKLFIWLVEKSTSLIKDHHLKVRKQAMYLAQLISIRNAGGIVEVRTLC